MHPSGVTTFEVKNGMQSYGVNLDTRICTCRMWEVSGIPCVHAQSAIIYTQQDPARFISSWFDKDKFLATYASNILPVNSSTMWPKSPFIKPQPPVDRRMPGRPSIKRKRHASEHQDKHSLGKRTVSCQNCQQAGHNRRNCKNPTVAAPPKPVKKFGRPRLNPKLTYVTRGKRGPQRGSKLRGRGRGKAPQTESVPQTGPECEVEVEVMVESESEGAPEDWVEVEVEGVPETAPEAEFEVENESEINEGDGMDIADLDTILSEMRDLKESDYCQQEIIHVLGLSQAQYNEFEAMLKQVPVPEPVPEPIPEQVQFSC